MYRSLRSSGHLRLLNWWAEGALAACLGVATLAMLVLLLWISSPHAHGGPSDALRIAAGLWLLAHGVELVRPETLGGGAAPLALTPLLLTALPALLLYRCVRTLEGAAWRIVLCVSAGYLLVAGLATWYTQSGPFQAVPLSAALRVPLLTLLCVGVGVWAARGWPPPTRAVLPDWLPWHRVFTALRAAVLAVVVLVTGGALLAALSLALHWGAATEATTQLTDAWSGRVAVVLVCLILAPNAALWGTAYVLGPGFTVGAGNTVGPLAASAPSQLPNFPLLAAVPTEFGGGPVTLALVAGLPLLAGTVAGLSTGRCSAPVRGSGHGADSALGTAGTVLLVGLGCGLGTAALAGLAGGSLGTGVLAVFGPTWWLVGAAAMAWTSVGALPTALAVRWWRIREPQPLLAVAIGWRRLVGWLGGLRPRRTARTAVKSRKAAKSSGGSGTGSAQDWHATGSRHSRWAALKVASGGLMPDLSAGRKPDQRPGTEPNAEPGELALGERPLAPNMLPHPPKPAEPPTPVEAPAPPADPPKPVEAPELPHAFETDETADTSAATANDSS